MKKFLILASLAASASASFAELMIPDSGAGDRVMLFSSVDGSLIDANWITDIGAVGWAFTTPKEARKVGNQIWVSDQVTDAIHRFDMNRNYVSSITSHPGGGVLDNVRGFGIDGSNRVYLTLMHGTAALKGIVVYDYSGANVSFFPGTGSYFDAEPYNGELLVTNSTSNNLERWSLTGTFLGNFKTGVTFPQQVEILPDNTVVVTATIAANGVEGVYHLSSTGTTLRFIDTEPIEEQVPRGGYPLADGNWLVATSTGVWKYFVGTNTFTQILPGVDAQYIAPIALTPTDIVAAGYQVNYGVETTAPGVANLQANDSDTVQLCLNPDQEDPNPVQMEVSATNGNVNPSSLNFNLVCRAEANDREVYVEMFSFGLGDWVGSPSFPVTDSDALYTVAAPGTAGQFVNDGDGAMITRITGFLGAADSPTLPCWDFNYCYWE